jgi:hypothetical protein
MAEIRLPNINGGTEKEQLTQIKSYLYQLTGQLNYALKQVNTELAKTQEAVFPTEANGSSAATEKEKLDQFIELKNLIIKSADTVQAFEDIVTQKLEGNYVATSEFGEYKKTTDAQLEETSEHATTAYTSVQTIEDKVNNLNEMRKNGCYIKTGWLDDNNTTAGFEVGQYEERKTTDTDGKETIEYFDKGFARFTTDKLSFYGEDGSELAYFAKYVMHITKAEIKQSLRLGGYLVDLTDGVAFKWEERSDN